MLILKLQQQTARIKAKEEEYADLVRNVMSSMVSGDEEAGD
jgi:hypothetical protein